MEKKKYEMKDLLGNKSFLETRGDWAVFGTKEPEQKTGSDDHFTLNLNTLDLHRTITDSTGIRRVPIRPRSPYG